MDSKYPTTEDEKAGETARQDHRPQVPPKLSELRFKLGQKAKQEPKFRFYSLYGHLLRHDVLFTAWVIVRDSKGGRTPGVDGVTVDHIVDEENGAEKLLTQLEEELREKSYKPDPVKRIEIPKANGKMRPLGIPTVRDRVAQTALLLLLEPIFDADFLDNSYGFRPGRSAQQAVAQIASYIKDDKLEEVYDADLAGYFDSIPHDKLMKGVETRISDHSILKLIRLFLRAPVQEGKGPPKRPKTGTPQGGVISPLLANSFLHWFDRAFYSTSGPGTWAQAQLVRYADDFVVMARTIDERIERWIEHTIENRLGLEINRTKTKVVKVRNGETLEFLGYSFRWRRSLMGKRYPPYLRIEASKRAQQKARDKTRELTGPQFGYLPPEAVVDRLNRFLRGWLAYFCFGHPGQARWDLVRFAEQRVAQHLKRKSQRPYRPPEGVALQKYAHDLGLIAVKDGPRG